ncbi:MAG TPA: serine hydrolase [Candidatus Stackebrandtia faecavium]|nr:serine hydrolase [Candidatus Stackebrandtia faecavium]
MSGLVHAEQWLVDNFDRLVGEHEVPGASIAILTDGKVVSRAAGLLNLNTGVPATVDSVFQIGSITKLWTATLVMQLVAEDQVDLDEPICSYLPGFRIADPHARNRITTRHLLSHCAGFEGDIFDETSNDDDAVAKFMHESLTDVPQLFAPGERFSYNNAGYVVLGRLVEVMREMTWEQALRRYLVEPLGVDPVATGSHEAVLLRAAAGHVRDHKHEPLRVTQQWALPRSNGPAGAQLAMPADQLLKFAQMYLADGRTNAGEQLLPSAIVAGMQRQQIPVPKRQPWSLRYGLAWALYDYGGANVIGHDGHTIGQSALLRIVPDRKVAVALLMNGGYTDKLGHAVLEGVLKDLAEVEVPRPYEQPVQVLPIEDPRRYVGKYENRVLWVTVSHEDGRLWADSAARGDVAEADGSVQAEHQELVRIDGDTFAVLDEDGSVETTCVFVGEDHDGRAKFLHNHRAVARVD